MWGFGVRRFRLRSLGFRVFFLFTPLLPSVQQSGKAQSKRAGLSQRAQNLSTPQDCRGLGCLGLGFGVFGFRVWGFWV